MRPNEGIFNGAIDIIESPVETSTETIDKLWVKNIALEVEIKRLTESVAAWQEIARDLNDRLEGTE